MKKIFATMIALASALALSLVLVGCGGGSQAPDPTGEWTLYEMTSEDPANAASPEDVQTMTDYGLSVTMTLNEDGTGSMNAFGEVLDVTWEQGDEGLTISLGGSPATASINENGMLSVDVGDGDFMIFQRTDAAAADAAA